MFDVELEAGELEEVLRRFPQVERMVDRRIRAAMERMLAYLQQKAVRITHEKDLVNSGAYVGSLETKIRGWGRGVRMRGQVGPTVAHGEPVERGRKAGKWPPPGPIELWVRRKLGINNDAQVRAVGFLIARAIATKGTIARFGYKGGEVMEETAEQGERRVRNMWRGEVQDLGREIANYLAV
jgi:hypothetical protein